MDYSKQWKEEHKIRLKRRQNPDQFGGRISRY